MPRFNKNDNELTTHFDKWLYFLKNLPSLDHIPDILKESVFIKGFEVAEIANFNQEQLDKYEESLKNYRDLKGVLDTAFMEGKIEGKIEGEKNKAIETAIKMKKDNLNIEIISKYTGLSIEEAEKL